MPYNLFSLKLLKNEVQIINIFKKRNSFIEHNKCQVLTLFSSINSKPLSVLIRFDPIRFDVSGQ